MPPPERFGSSATADFSAMTEEQIEAYLAEEIGADAYAGMNDFAAQAETRSAVQDTVAAAQTADAQVQQEAQQDKQAPPVGRAAVNVDVSESQQFRRWFGESKVVNPDGTPKVVYHATDSMFTIFDCGHLGKNVRGEATDEYYEATAYIGFWHNTRDLSQYFGDGAHAQQNYLCIENPYEALSLDGLVELLKEHGNSDNPKEIAENTLICFGAILSCGLHRFSFPLA